METRTMFYDTCKSPLGPLLLVGDGNALHHVGLPESRHPLKPQAHWKHAPQVFSEARRQFDAYFSGTASAFDLALAPQGTEFQCRVWMALREIPYASTISYAELARRTGNAKASRAVGLANGANPLPIIVPCHRVIGANGSLTGFGGGLAAKKFLLDLEQRHAPVRALALSP
ncbi:MAG: methylated-DNA--[protein]-cysteine S-methyltransferase [Gammaproteobacteria bacterium]|nr:MAG: methylated-DNA--[protein]-cysteine S-methyltransferase [Gammaproteobacteria bacterium]